MVNLHTMTGTSVALDTLCINTIRFLSVDAVEAAESGHPGLPMGAAPMAYVLWTRHLKHNPENPRWFDRDRFILSAGHGSMLLYSLLFLTGYDLPIEQIRRFRHWGSMTPGHPERGHTPGVEMTTGPLGQGIANAVGAAIAEANLAARYNRSGFDVCDHRTWVIASDGDLMEGVASEAASLAGHLRLHKLSVLYDMNHVTLAAGTNVTFTEDVAKRFEAYGWRVESLENGNDPEAIDLALTGAQNERARPSLVIVHTHLGYGAPTKQDTFEAHGAPLGAEETRAAKERLGWPTAPPFLVPEEALLHFRSAVERGLHHEHQWNELMIEYRRNYPEPANELETMIHGDLPAGWDESIPTFPPDRKGLATRVASGRVMQAIAPKLPALIGGSADLDPSTHTQLKGLGDFQDPAHGSTIPGSPTDGASGGGWNYAGRNIHFGVREHAMGGVMNGIASHGGLLPYGSTFLIFSDYMRPPIRLAALMKLHLIYIFTHDSIALGEDGPTHQPIEQLAGLRAIPNLLVIRPCDANETAVAWRVAVETRDRPVALILTRQNVPTLNRARYAAAEGLRRGAYVISDPPDGNPASLILMATGSEVALCLEAAERLREDGVLARVVSMPSARLFEEESAEYRMSVLPSSVGARIAVEAASPFGWERWVGETGTIIGIDRFGASAPGDVVLRQYGFNVNEIRIRALELAR
jgi:transketolase